MPATRGAAAVNKSVVMNAKGLILQSLDLVSGRVNNLMNTTLAPGAAVGYMNCQADIYVNGVIVQTAYYTPGESIHAEMNALADFVCNGRNLPTITQIDITAPPCKSCAFVMELLGVVHTVRTTGATYKNFTSAWNWPDELQNAVLFDPIRWNQLNNFFSKSGYSHAQKIEAIVKVVRTLTFV